MAVTRQTRQTTQTRGARQRRDRDESARRPARRGPASNRGRRPAAARQRTGTRPTRRKAMRRRWIAVLTVLTVAGVGYLLFFTSLLGVRQVEVLGAKGVPVEDIRTAAAVPDRRAMLRLDTDQIRNRVVAMPGIATADVSRSWPSTLEITVTERTAIGFYELGDGIHLVDGEGVDFKTVKENPGGLPQLKLTKVATDDPSTRAVTAVLATIPPQLRGQVAAAGAATPGSVELNLSNGKLVRWGNAAQVDRKAKVLAALLTRDGKTYDVSSPELPTVS
ncbi:cell division protein FtsQ/DivIB [Amycolatopsis nigrescens]|uniref:cell division protein FtsQ/DivIB n=1 Tax=Amycolatopsis nigrescens TaxID=381445 RepID=UPI0003751D5D|nr:FtsQ-type POTRA domain-containing protein [Amycolatopsis nigrescens]